MEGKNRKTKVSGFSIVLLTAVLVFIGCPGTVGSSGSGNGEITPPSGDVGSFEDTGDGFIKISPPAAGITGMDTDPASLPGTEDYWKGVFLEGRKVKLSPYKLGKTEVPYKLWKEVHDWAIQPANGYKFANAGVKGKDGSGSEEEPVTTVSWRDCIVWCNAYTQKIKGEGECVYRKSKTDTTVLKDATDTAACDSAYADMSKEGYRLPTEAEWEYAARWQGSDNTNADKYGNVWLTKLNSASGAQADWNNADETKAVAWYGDNADSKTHPVGEKRKNALGLHDMSGNVLEWCFDRYDNNPTANDGAYESGGFVTDPQGAASGADRVERRGSWSDDARDCVVGIRRQRARCGHLRCRFTKNSPQRISTAKDGSGSNRYRVRSANSQTKNVQGCTFLSDGIHAAAAINAQRSICTISYNKLIE